MKKKLSANELEIRAAAAGPPRTRGIPVPTGEVLAMLARRGFRPKQTMRDIPFPRDVDEEVASSLMERLSHYAFRLFLRGAIQRSGGFRPAETTRYLTTDQSKECAEFLVRFGLAQRLSRGCYRLAWPARSFGGTLEWYVARELERRYGFDVSTGVKLHAHGVGGDLDIVAAAEGKLVYLELKSSPPKNLSAAEIAAFFERVNLLRPDLTLFVVDTALRLADKVVPMLLEEFKRRFGGSVIKPKQIARELWALTPHVYVVNGRRDLMANIGRALATGFFALSPSL